MWLAPNFELREFVELGTHVPEEVLANLKLVAASLQVIRGILDKPIKINSGYRTPEENEAVGGAPNSKHLTGKAVDIQLSNGDQIILRLQDTWAGGYGKGNGWCHLDLDSTKINGKYRRWKYGN